MFDIRFYGTTASGARIQCAVTGDADPGYGSTAKMLGEAAMALIETNGAPGFHTPTTAFGDDLIARLEAHAGLEFSMI